MVYCSAKNKFFCVKLSPFNKKVLFQWLKKNKNYVFSTSYGTSVIHWNYTFPFFLMFFNLPVSFLPTVLILLQPLSYFFSYSGWGCSDFFSF